MEIVAQGATAGRLAAAVAMEADGSGAGTSPVAHSGDHAGVYTVCMCSALITHCCLVP